MLIHLTFARQQKSVKGLGCQTDLAAVQRDSASATKQTSGNQLNSPKVTAGGQLEKRQFQNFFDCLFHETLLQLSFKYQMNRLNILCNIIGYTVHIAEIVQVFNSGSPDLRLLDLIQLGTLFNHFPACTPIPVLSLTL